MPDLKWPRADETPHPKSPDLIEATILQVKSIYSGSPQSILKCLSLRILSIGGWVMRQRSQPAEGTASIVIEFEACDALGCFAALVESGLCLSKKSYFEMTSLCNCTLQFRTSPRFICTLDIAITCIPTTNAEQMELVTAVLGIADAG